MYIDPDLLADYARGYDPEYDYEPSYDLDIVGDGVDVHLRGKGLNPEGDYHNYYDDEILGRFYIDAMMDKEGKANFSVYIEDDNDNRVYLLQTAIYVGAGEPIEEDQQALLGGKLIHLHACFALRINKK